MGNRSDPIGRSEWFQLTKEISDRLTSGNRGETLEALNQPPPQSIKTVHFNQKDRFIFPLSFIFNDQPADCEPILSSDSCLIKDEFQQVYSVKFSTRSRGLQIKGDTCSAQFKN